MRIHPTIILATIAALAGAEARAADPANGQELHDPNCLRCHQHEVYTRKDRMVNSLSSLDAQVRRCDQAVKTQWFDDEIADVAEYLNTRFYKLEK